MVLNEICDDFENVDQIVFPHVARDMAVCGMKVTRAEVVTALRGLVGDGFAKAYTLSGRMRDPFAGELKSMPAIDEPEEDFSTYFYVTPEGLALHEADGSWYPFDDEGDLKAGWNPPE
jgi:hypothetical protein